LETGEDAIAKGEGTIAKGEGATSSGCTREDPWYNLCLPLNKFLVFFLVFRAPSPSVVALLAAVPVADTMELQAKNAQETRHPKIPSLNLPK
jgi:hypothetical protein